ncbi:hypothetical protein SAMN05444266_101626 [Chitinophaga jiangningensis]|uniref:Uncharacterized protein n=1 Tax=Chitinophaga jiangningensis TaxID=1419482 RepID=A0A1M6WHC6_9BACT|nr:hypothetical protein [Chitinophaga jiangningensis]SHK93117.1 hypothetical protein SAMN05444266_101626 [Chitinophaga jiangningensis]
MANELNLAVDILVKAKEDVVALIADDHKAYSLVVIGGMDAIINRLKYPSKRLSQQALYKFEPITNFMGDEISRPELLTKEDLSPDEARKAEFIRKVDMLLAQFTTMDPAGILSAYTMPEDQLVVRGVAKRAGIDDYRDRPVDLRFIEDIAGALEEAAASSAEQKRIDTELGGNGTTNIAENVNKQSGDSQTPGSTGKQESRKSSNR